MDTLSFLKWMQLGAIAGIILVNILHIYKLIRKKKYALWQEKSYILSKFSILFAFCILGNIGVLALRGTGYVSREWQVGGVLCVCVAVLLNSIAAYLRNGHYKRLSPEG